jgi:hypothetical protein
MDAGEGYFPAMKTLHKRKQYNFRRTISQPLNQTLDMVLAESNTRSIAGILAGNFQNK